VRLVNLDGGHAGDGLLDLKRIALGIIVDPIDADGALGPRALGLEEILPPGRKRGGVVEEVVLAVELDDAAMVREGVAPRREVALRMPRSPDGAFAGFEIERASVGERSEWAVARRPAEFGLGASGVGAVVLRDLDLPIVLGVVVEFGSDSVSIVT